MPSQFSSLGFEAASGEDLAALASRVAERAESVFVDGGEYLRWSPPSGEQLWLQLKKSGDAMGMTPHFSGKSSVPACIDARIVREKQTALDGTFLAWANPEVTTGADGDYPFVFDCPDAGVHAKLILPALVIVQVAAFAQTISLYASEEHYATAQAAQGMSFPAKSFIPSGLVSPSGQPVSPPEPHALLSGYVIEAEERHNAMTGNPFFWALVETLGGTFDVVIDPSLVTHRPAPGNLLSAWCWLSGRLLRDEGAIAPARGWFGRLTSRT